MDIRPLTLGDRDAWESLWQESVGGVMTPDIIADSFKKILRNQDVFALLAYDDDGKAMGLLHYVVHQVVGCMTPVCYMQDLYVKPDYRRRGIAKTLLTALKVIAKKDNYDRIYWLHDNSNKDAEGFYQNEAIALDFGLYMIPVGMKERLGL